MKTQKLLIVTVFLFLTFNLFSQEKEGVENDEEKLTYAKTKELFLTVIDSLNNENRDVIGTFTINKLPIIINEKDKTKDTILPKEAKFFHNLLKINNNSKFKNKDRERIVRNYFKHKIDSLNLLKMNHVKFIKEDTLVGKESEIYVRNQLNEIDLINNYIKELTINGDEVFNKFFNSDKYSKEIIDYYLNRKIIWLVNDIQIEIKDGFIIDVLVTLIEKLDSEIKIPKKRYFTNQYSSSLVFFNNYEVDELKERGGNKTATIQLFDVINYQHKMGKNFTPNDRTINISRKEGFKDLTLDNNLDSFLDFRIYSDFLGLINETPNGIINFETSSNIIVNPKKWFSKHIFKSITPFLRYSRFDNNNRKAFLKQSDSSLVRKLDLEQKSFLSIGLNFNIFEYKPSKETPVTFSFPFGFRMNITEAGIKDDDSEENNTTVNTLVYSTGLNAEFRRINNFGLNLGLIYEWYDQKSNSDIISPFDTFNTIGVSSELYYYSPKNKNSAFFLRFRTNRLFSIDGLENYAAVQFGYKSSLNFSTQEKK